MQVYEHMKKLVSSKTKEKQNIKVRRGFSFLKDLEKSSSSSSFEIEEDLVSRVGLVLPNDRFAPVFSVKFIREVLSLKNPIPPRYSLKIQLVLLFKESMKYEPKYQNQVILVKLS